MSQENNELPIRLQLRPGIQVFVVSADEIQLAAVNHSTTFTSIPVVNLVETIVDATRVPTTRSEIVELAASKTDSEPALVQYVIELMRKMGCLVTRSAEDDDELDALGQFHASVGIDPDSSAGKLKAARPVVVTPTASATVLEQALVDSGIDAELIAVEAGSPCSAALDRVRAAFETCPGPLAVWDIPWRMPFARRLNEVALERPRPVLFGVCEGAVGRLGPYVVSRDTACLECVLTRSLTNAGENELRVIESYRARLGDVVPQPLPGHPAFRRAMAGLFAVELSQILLFRPPTTLGGYVEYVFGGIGARRRVALRSPRCPACHPEHPPRLAWNARFPAPLVKSGAA
ncbi:MAG: hypothetical protein K0V04_02250 [Deltaproteobacteria bacterium]|nr:hypothetical protein [Deltaproteobacteria bacterium]